MVLNKFQEVVPIVLKSSKRILSLPAKTPLKTSRLSKSHHKSMSFSKNGPIEAEPKNKRGRDEKIRILYEEYISLHPVMHVVRGVAE